MSDFFEDINNAADKSAVIKDQKVSRFAYTETAYTNDDAAGVNEFDRDAEQNVPVKEEADLDPFVVDKGMRTQAASFPRMSQNHFFGRISYNLNKTVDWFNDVANAVRKAFSKEGFEYSPYARYSSGDCCYLLSIEGGQEVRNYYKRTGTLPETIHDIHPLDSGQWQFWFKLPNEVQIGGSGVVNYLQNNLSVASSSGISHVGADSFGWDVEYKEILEAGALKAIFPASGTGRRVDLDFIEMDSNKVGKTFSVEFSYVLDGVGDDLVSVVLYDGVTERPINISYLPNPGVVIQSVKAQVDAGDVKTGLKLRFKIKDATAVTLYLADSVVGPYKPAVLSPDAAVGAIHEWGSATLPDETWKFCDGSAISRTQYAELFRRYGTTWGVGDGSTTFNLPDFRSAAPTGVGTSTGYTQNETIALATKYNDQVQQHIHNQSTLQRETGTSSFPSGSSYYADTTAATLTSGGIVSATLNTGVNTARLGNVTRGKRVGVNFIIKVLPSPSVNMATDFQEFAFNTDTTESNNTTSFGYGVAGALVPNKSGVSPHVTKIVQFERAVQARDTLSLELYDPRNGMWYPFESNAYGTLTYHNEGVLSYGAYISQVPGESKKVSVIFAQYMSTGVDGYATAGSTWASAYASGFRWRVRKVSNGNMAEYSGRAAAVALSSEGYMIGKNKIINGNFDIWQRGILVNVNSGQAFYLADRFNISCGNVTTQVTQQLFTNGQTEVPNNPTYFLRSACSVSTNVSTNQHRMAYYIEDVHTFAGKKATLSFYAKADAVRNFSIRVKQFFGSGGSPSVATDIYPIVRKNALSTSWQKYTFTVDIPSISGKTIGTDGPHTSALGIWIYLSAGTDLATETDNLGVQTGTFDFAQFQFEEGEVATKFEQRPIELELSLCERYLETSFRLNSGVGPTNNAGGDIGNVLQDVGLHSLGSGIYFKTKKRRNPTITLYNPISLTGSGQFYVVGGSSVALTLGSTNISTDGFIPLGNSSAGSGYIYVLTAYAADAEF